MVHTVEKVHQCPQPLSALVPALGQSFQLALHQGKSRARLPGTCPGCIPPPQPATNYGDCGHLQLHDGVQKASRALQCHPPHPPSPTSATQPHQVKCTLMISIPAPTPFPPPQVMLNRLKKMRDLHVTRVGKASATNVCFDCANLTCKNPPEINTSTSDSARLLLAILLVHLCCGLPRKQRHRPNDTRHCP